MTPDPKWLEILKASGWQTTGLACAFGVFLLVLPRFGLSPAQASVATAFAALAFLVCAFLALASIGHAVNEFFRPKAWLHHWITEKRQRRWLRDYIPHMTDEEKSILAYLLAHNRKVITTAQDGGYAATLISKGVLLLSVRAGQVVSSDDVPYAIPTHMWDELQAHKEQFPYKPKRPRAGEVEPYPWRRHWMA